MDYKFELENGRAEQRVCAIIYNLEGNKILAFRVIGRDFWMLPGGRKNLFETSENAIKREIKEELGLELDFKFKLTAEVIMKINENTFDQTNFIYTSYCDETLVKNGTRPIDNDGQEFAWLEIDKIEQGVLEPSDFIKYVKENDDKIYHLIIDKR